MTYTQTELVSAALADPDRAPMRLHEIVSEEIRVFQSSPRYRELLEADAAEDAPATLPNSGNASAAGGAPTLPRPPNAAALTAE